MTDRAKELAIIQRMAEQLHSPRLHMMLIVALTGASGFLASVALLQVGMVILGLRYAIAVAIAYLFFLGLLWCWLRLTASDFFDGITSIDLIPDSNPFRSSTSRAPDAPASCDPSPSSFDGPQLRQALPESGSESSADSSSVLDAAGGLDLDELAIVVVAVVALVGALWVALTFVWAAPALFAEIVLDAALSAGLYHRLRGIEGDHWLRTAIRRTWLPFAVVAMLFALAGTAMQAYAPEARSIGEVLRHHNGSKPTPAGLAK